MKLIGYILLGIVSFALTVFGLVAATGNLPNLQKIFKGEVAEKKVVEEPDELDQLARELKAREERLTEQEAKLSREEEQLKQRQQELDDTLSKLEDISGQIQESIGEADADREERLKVTAESYAAMKAANAAEALKDWPAEDAANILRLIKDKDRGKILDQMEPRQAALILRTLQEREY